jgi:hypothetical protein
MVSLSLLITQSRALSVTNGLSSPNLWAESFRVETVSASVAQRCYAGTICLELVDNYNETHVYEIPEAIYDPSTKFNLIRIPFLVAYFNDNNYSFGDDVDANGTTDRSSGCCLKLVWDHGKHTRNFTHGELTLPELILYQGHG